MTLTSEDFTKPDAGQPEVSVTIKAHTGFDAPWIVARGGSIAEVNQMLQGPVDELISTVLGVDQLFHAAYVAAEGLGAQPVGKGRGNYRKPSGTAPKAARGQSAGEAQGEAPKAEPHPFQEVLDGIGAAADAKAVQRVWAKTRIAHKTDIKVHQGWPSAELEQAAAEKLAALKKG